MAIKPLFRIDLGITEEPQPCRRHQSEGVQAGCEGCEDEPPKVVPVPELEGFWVEIRNPRVLAYGEKKRLFQTTVPILPGDSIDDQLAKRQMAEERLERIVKGLITAWNLKAPDDPDGEVLPIPSQSSDALDRAPDIVGAVMEGLAREQSRQPERLLPKASTT